MIHQSMTSFVKRLYLRSVKPLAPYENLLPSFYFGDYKSILRTTWQYYCFIPIWYPYGSRTFCWNMFSSPRSSINVSWAFLRLRDTNEDNFSVSTNAGFVKEGLSSSIHVFTQRSITAFCSLGSSEKWYKNIRYNILSHWIFHFVIIYSLF